MKTPAITSVALIVLMCFVIAQSPATKASPSSRTVQQTIYNQVRQIRNGYNQMNSTGQVNDQVLISAVQALFTLVQFGLGGVSPQIQSQVMPQFSTLQNQIGSMSSSRKFNPYILDSFRSFAETIKSDTKAQNSAYGK